MYIVFNELYIQSSNFIVKSAIRCEIQSLLFSYT